jgi:hypothetical protein
MRSKERNKAPVFHEGYSIWINITESIYQERCNMGYLVLYILLSKQFRKGLFQRVT